MDSFSIEDGEAGQRLDRVLCARLGLSRSGARDLLDRGAVRRNGRRGRKGELVERGDRIQVEVALEELDPRAEPDPNVSLRVCYEDEELALVDKPAGMPSHPLRPRERGCLANGVLARYPETAHVGYDERQPGLLNRLDNDTSGLVIIARTGECFAALRRELEAARIEKRYLALTSHPVALQVIELPLAPREQGARVEVVAPHAQGEAPARRGARPRAATTRVLGCREVGPDRYLVELDAGRAYRHQVRVHLAAIGSPIVGDVLYGGAPAPRHYLHASRIALTHPRTSARIEVESPLPSDWPL